MSDAGAGRRVRQRVGDRAGAREAVQRPHRVQDLLSKWRHTAYLEMRDPGSYYLMLAKAEEITRTGHNPDAVSYEDMQALLRQRLGA